MVLSVSRLYNLPLNKGQRSTVLGVGFGLDRLDFWYSSRVFGGVSDRGRNPGSDILTDNPKP